MGELRTLIHKSLSESADKMAIDALLDKYSIEDIDSPEKAVNFTIKTDVFRRGLDSLVQDRVKKHDERFKAEKLPELLKAEKEKIMSELNPPKTEKDEKLSAMAKELEKMKLNNLKKDFEIKKKELSLPDDYSIERYLPLGEDGLELMEADSKVINTHIEERAKKAQEEFIKTQFKGMEIPKKSSEENIKTMARADFDRMDPPARAAFIKEGGRPV